MDVLKKVAKCYKDIKTVFATKLKIAVGAIEEVATAINNFVVGEIDEVVNSYEQKDANVKEQLMNKMITGLDVHVDNYKNDKFNGSEIMFAPSAPVSTANLANCFRDCKNLLYVDTLYGNEEGGIYKPASLSYTFSGSDSLEIVDLSKIDLSDCTNMNHTFNMCKSLSELDVRDLDVSSLKTLDHAFYGCSSLTELDVSNWDVRSLENMTYAFYGCANLTELDVSNWHSSSLTNISYAFNSCKGLTYLDLSNWDLSNVTDAKYFFASSGIERLLLPQTKFNKKVDLTSMFRETKIENLDLSCFDISNGAICSNMFYACIARRLNISSWKFENCDSIFGMFASMNYLGSDDNKLVLGDCKTSNVKSYRLMFYQLSSKIYSDVIKEVVGIDVSSVNHVLNENGLFLTTSQSDNVLYNMFNGSKIDRCIFAGNHNIMFDCIFDSLGWQNLDSDSIASFIVNCLYDYSEDEGEHIFKVTSAMYNELQTKSYGGVENVYEHIFELGWDLQYS